MFQHYLTIVRSKYADVLRNRLIPIMRKYRCTENYAYSLQRPATVDQIFHQQFRTDVISVIYFFTVQTGRPTDATYGTVGHNGNFWRITKSRFDTNFLNVAAIFGHFSKGPFSEGSITTLGSLFGFPYEYRFGTFVDP